MFFILSMAGNRTRDLEKLKGRQHKDVNLTNCANRLYQMIMETPNAEHWPYQFGNSTFLVEFSLINIRYIGKI